MNTLQLQIGRVGLIGVLALSAGARAGQGGPGGADEFSYRCRLLGDAGACAVLDATRRGLPVPGPYAIALISKGVGREEALAAAAALGEHPTPARRVQPGTGGQESAQHAASGPRASASQ